MTNYIYALFFITSLSLTAPFYLQTQTNDAIHHEINVEHHQYPQWHQQHAKWRMLLKKHFGSLAIGATIGVLTGTCCFCFDKYTPIPFPINWIIFMTIRRKLTGSIVKDMKQYEIDHNGETITTTAWLSDWITYLYQVAR